MNFDDAIASHIKWKVRISRFIDGNGAEILESARIGRDDLCELGQWIYGEGAKYASFPQYERLVKRHAEFHQRAGEVVKLVERQDTLAAKAALYGPFTTTSKQTVVAIMDLRRATTEE